VDQRGAENPNRDLLHADDGDVKNAAGIGHRRKTNQARGVAGQHKGVGPGRAFQQGEPQAEYDPARQHHAAQDWRIREGRHNHNGRAGTRHGTGQPVEASAQRCPDRRLRHDVNRNNGPRGTFETDRQREVISQHRRGKTLRGIDQRARIVSQRGGDVHVMRRFYSCRDYYRLADPLKYSILSKNT
jgi:hypothetical protein